MTQYIIDQRTGNIIGDHSESFNYFLHNKQLLIKNIFKHLNIISLKMFSSHQIWHKPQLNDEYLQSN